MIQDSNFDRVMESRDHFKDGASSKSQMSRGNKNDLSFKFLAMKNIFLLLSICLLASNLFSVYGQSDFGNEKYRRHTGFYLSMSVGPTFGGISYSVKGSPGQIEFSGTGAQFDLKIGGAVKENLILHASMITTSISGAKVNQAGRLSENVSISENMLIGGGLTYYVMPSNIFLSGSAGMGYYNIIDTKESDNNIKTDNGFSMQLKVGKEWWVGKKWGLGVALTYGTTIVNNGPYDGIEEKLTSNRFGILFNVTLN